MSGKVDRLQPLKVYTIIRTAEDADYGTFERPSARGSWFSRERAMDKLAETVKDETNRLDERFDTLKRGPDFWEVSKKNYRLYIRLEIVESSILDSLSSYK